MQDRHELRTDRERSGDHVEIEIGNIFASGMSSNRKPTKKTTSFLMHCIEYFWDRDSQMSNEVANVQLSHPDPGIFDKMSSCSLSWPVCMKGLETNQTFPVSLTSDRHTFRHYAASNAPIEEILKKVQNIS